MSDQRSRAALASAAVFIVALTLRPALTTVGPLLPIISDDLQLNEIQLGLLTAIPLLAFAVFSPLVHRLAAAVGIDVAVLYALVLLSTAILIRSALQTPGLWLGTVLVGCAISVGNVLLPAIVKRDYPRHIPRATSIYSACITLAAAFASAAAVPIALRTSWRTSLAVWAGLSAVIAVLWGLRVIMNRSVTARVQVPTSGATHQVTLGSPSSARSRRRRPFVPAEGPQRSVWRRREAWLITAFMGLQSTSFYFVISWLPTIEATHGVSETTAGYHLFVLQALGVVAGLCTPYLLRNPLNLTSGIVIASSPMFIAALGMTLLPGLMIWWVVIAGLGQGASFVVALSVIGLRGRGPYDTARLSGMAQSLGYVLAATGPLLAGWLTHRTGDWQASLWLLTLVSGLQILVGVRIGKPRED